MLIPLTIFYTFPVQQEQEAPELEQQASQLQLEAQLITIEGEAEVSEYHSWTKQLEKIHSQMMDVMRQPAHIIPFMMTGRLIRVKARLYDAVDTEGLDWG